MPPRLSLQSKMNTFTAGILLIALSLVCFLVLQIISQYMNHTALENAKRVMAAFETKVITEPKAHMDEHIDLLIKNKTFIEHLKLRNTKALTQTYGALLNSEEVSFISVYDSQGLVVEGGLLSNDLRQLFLSRIGYNRMDLKKPLTWVDGNAKMGLYIFSATPVYANNQVIGMIYAGEPLTKQSSVEDLKRLFDMDATLFAENIRYNTTLSQNNRPLLFTPLNPQISDLVLTQGKSFSGTVQVLNSTYIASYKPILGFDHKPIGVIFVGKSKNDLNKIYYKIVLVVIALGAILFTIGIMFAQRWIQNLLISPLSKLAKYIEYFNDDSPFEMTKPYTHIEEIDALYDAFGNMSEEIALNHKKLEYVAYTHRLTGLKNRSALYKHYSPTTVFSPLEQIGYLMYLNIDNLKHVNDLIGHSVGDLLLQHVGMRLNTFVNNESEIDLFHLSGDEFVITQRGSFMIQSIYDIADQILHLFSEPFYIDVHQLRVSVSIGIAYCDSHEKKCLHCENKCSKSIDTMLKDAEIALYQAKQDGKHCYRLFDHAMYDLIKEKAALERDLLEAFERNEFFLHYQPKYNAQSESIVGFEALLRWTNARGESISPNVFIPIAEELGLILQLGEWVLKEACTFIQTYNRTHHSNLIMAVNVSAIQLLSDAFTNMVITTLENNHFEASHLEIEITESVLMDSLEKVNEKLDTLLSLGVSIALDDFGSGYSSLRYLRQIPITTLKIDRTFIQEFDNIVPENNLIVDMIQMGHRLGLEIVAEGVETNDQLQYLKTCGCDTIQGYYFNKPLPENQAMLLAPN